jgi:hypothetical protein
VRADEDMTAILTQAFNRAIPLSSQTRYKGPLQGLTSIDLDHLK